MAALIHVAVRAEPSTQRLVQLFTALAGLRFGTVVGAVRYESCQATVLSHVAAAAKRRAAVDFILDRLNRASRRSHLTNTKVFSS